MMTESEQGLTRTILGALLLVAMIGVSLWILHPFLPAILWATTIVAATWPLMIRVQHLLWNRRGLAVTVMTGTLLLIFLLPFGAAAIALLNNSHLLMEEVSTLTPMELGSPPEQLVQLPYIGKKIAEIWNNIAGSGLNDIAKKAAPYIGDVARWFATQIGSIGSLLVQFLITIIFAAIIYARGEYAAAKLIQFATRIAGARGENSVILAGQAVRGVALGIVVTAIIQSVVAGIFLSITSIPLAVPLTALIFIMCIAQLGPGFVLIPAIIWLYWSGQAANGTILLVASLVVVTMDNFIRPLLIKQGADLPFLIILTGVIGGLLAFGLIGIFIGPVVLAIAYTLFSAWIAEEPETKEDGA